MRFTRRSKWLLCTLLALVLWITPVAALASEQTEPAEQSAAQESGPKEETDVSSQPADTESGEESGTTDPADAAQ